MLGRYVDQVSSALHVGQSKRCTRLNVGQPLGLKQDLPKSAKSNTITGEEEGFVWQADGIDLLPRNRNTAQRFTPH